MSALQVFAFEGAEVRAITIDGEPWWIARDVCGVLSIRNVADALGSLDEDERGVVTADTPGGAQQVATINEPGLYSLILRSRKPQAKAFKRWITHEVIPAIRKTGSFTVKPLDELELAERQVVLIREKRAALARAVKAEAFQSAIEAGDGLTLRAFHKKYFSEVGERAFMDHLYARGYLIDQRGKGAERDDGTVRDGAQHRHPSAKGKHFFYLHGHGRHGGKRREATRVRPGAPELDLKAALIKDGMAANNNDTGRPLEIEAA
ncbi:Bro-N domain-containing protein [Streptomyces sp. NPDC127040]|uniref:BRO-N domain-containing protein n=1 Tax=Streptomyces sp. NPDC127040 TaxID=3347116 RepID=UPI00365FCF55